MRANKLRCKIRIETPTTVKDKFGALTITWNLFDSVWASIEPLKGADKISAAANYPKADVKIGIRYIVGVLPTMRIVYGNQIYSILGQPLNKDMRNREIEFVCETGLKAS